MTENDITYKVLDKLVFNVNKEYYNPLANYLLVQVNAAMGGNTEGWSVGTWCDRLLHVLNGQDTNAKVFLRSLLLSQEDFSLEVPVHLSRYRATVLSRYTPLFTCGLLYDCAESVTTIKDWLQQEYDSVEDGIQQQFKILGVKDWEREIPAYLYRQYRTDADRRCAYVAMVRSQLMKVDTPATKHDMLIVDTFSRYTVPTVVGKGMFDMYAAGMSVFLIRICTIYKIQFEEDVLTTCRRLLSALPIGHVYAWVRFVVENLERK